MKITDLHIDGFGVWSGLSVSDLPASATVIFGRNEAGKTTLLQFVRSVLYGFSPQRRQKYLPPVHGGLAGGSIYVASAHGNLEVQRHEARRRSFDEPALTDENGTVHRQPLLDKLLSGVDEPIFNNVFAIGLREIQQLGTLNDTQAADLLFDLSSGFDRVSLPEVLRELSATRRKILDEDGQPSEIAALFDDHERLSVEIDELTAGASRWLEIAGQCQRFDQEAAEIHHEIKRLEIEARNIELAVQVRDPWRARQQVDQQLAVLGVPADVDDQLLRQLDEVNYELKRRETQIQNIKRKRQDIRGEALSLELNSGVCANLARIEACGEHLKWISSLERQAEHLEDEINALTSELDVTCQASGVPIESVSGSLPEFSRQTFTLLEDPGLHLREAAQQVKNAVRERDQIGRESDQLAVRLNTTLSRRADGELHRSIDEVGEEVSLLRQRIQIDERIEKLERTQEDLEIEVDELLERQVLPVWQLVGLGVPFVVGIMLILIGMFWTSSSVVGWLLVVLGTGGWCVAIATKMNIERNLAKELETCSQQLERLREEISTQVVQRDELDLQLADSDQPLDVRLQDSERQLERLEEMLPVSAELQAAEQRCNEAAIRVSEATDELTGARQRWTDVLQAVGLPTHLEPDNIRDMIAAYEQAAVIWEKRETRRHELQQRQQDYESICQRIDKLSEETGVEIEGNDPKARLRCLLNLASDQQYALERKKKLRGRFQRLATRGKKCGKRIRQLTRRREQMLTTAGVANEDALRDLIAQNEQAIALRQQHNGLQDRIVAVVGGGDRISDVEQLLENFEDADLERRWDEIMAEVEVMQAEVAEGHQQLGEWTQEMRSLAEDRRLAEARLELNCVQQKLKQAVRRWQSLAVVSLLVQQMQAHFESERQPETLRDATRYLKQITAGRYVKLYTPYDENALRVNDAEGQKLSVEVLSQGTREAIYLSLRLALVAQFAKRKTSLPLILDDVLVNLDGDRAKAAAETLRDFSDEGHQLILFTCHEHILKLFKSVGAEIRQLPDHANASEEDRDVNELLAAAASTSDEDDVEDSHIEYDDPTTDDQDSGSWVESDLVTEEPNARDDEESIEGQTPLPPLTFGGPMPWWESPSNTVS